ncbi:hypothetical protein [Nitrincola tapanii]|uniref:Uncharacterized protein n=1 Tax=Nitrincola tapanii TaxID=1708751 RepID=A0A5A9W1E3_9GAMM|nr:hypothetical protein [Nitrincola tapanii]KAA0874373.1 hypothetical protein E1H14_08870 [Nitrincola tapanii]
MTIKLDKKKIRQDALLRICMYTGIPLSVLAIASLWLGQTLGSPLLGMVFMFSTALAILIGLIYNVRFVILSVRSLREQQAQEAQRNARKG